MDWNLSKLQEIVEDGGACCAAVRGVAESEMTDWLKFCYCSVIQLLTHDLVTE